ncbi:protoporphyrinogen oxidase HemJ [Aliidiomarina shirensis]|uniref:Protoporphyrinogen IX oxidase n=1 Tax=Aliidiomarina shirensis TaxID=1048642 RepID=A0A432WR43_9GAMM|nr:protoporphyrinogen oxidase HemJ [Aliidiomarina shirensis]RUO36199.1 protoporphyrinogen oxidase HemJ [Aliidiomarina shirensis]
MNEFLVFQWFKALHLVFMVAWFAGIFYLPRLFVYHAESVEPKVHAQLKIMERRLLYFVTPFMVLTIIFGFGMLYIYGLDWLRMNSWMHIKLLLVFILVIYHIYCFFLVRDFRNDNVKRSGRWFRWFNEMPVIMLFAIIILAVLKP